MKKLLIVLAWLLAAVPLAAQIIPPTQSISSASVGGACSTGTCATWTVPNSNPSMTAQISGTMTSMTVTFEGTSDGNTWFSILATNLSSGTSATTATATGQYALVNPGLVGFRVRCTTYASGAVNVSLTRGTASAKSGLGGGGGGGFTGNVYEWARGDGTFSQTMPRGTITASSPYVISETWNNAAVAFNAFNIAITDTASLPTTGPGAASASSAFSITTGVGDVFKVFKDTESGGGESTKFAIGLNTNATAVAASEDVVLKAASGGVVGFINSAQNIGRIFSARHIKLAGAGPEATTFPIIIGSDQFSGFQGASGRLFGWASSSTDATTLDTAIGRNGAGVVEANTGTLGTFGSFKGNYVAVTSLVSLTAPTIASGGCTSPAVTHSNGTAAFLITIGSACTGVKTITLTLPAASHFWACDANNNTSAAQQNANVLASLATSTTAVVLTNYARTTGVSADFTAADTLLVKCSGE